MTAPPRDTTRSARLSPNRCLTRAAGLSPRVPLRHWIATLGAPVVAQGGLRPDAAALRGFVGALFDVFRRTSARSCERARCGAVTVALTRGSVARPELALHALMLDGVCVDAGDPASGPRSPVFFPHAAAPDVGRVAAVVADRLVGRTHARSVRIEHMPVAGPAIRQPHAAQSVNQGREPTVRFRFPFALSTGASATEVSPAEIAGQLSERLCGAARRVRFHGILAAGSGRGTAGVGPAPSNVAKLAPRRQYLRPTGS